MQFPLPKSSSYKQFKFIVNILTQILEIKTRSLSLCKDSKNHYFPNKCFKHVHRVSDRLRVLPALNLWYKG